MKKSFFFLAGLLLLSACGEQQAQQAETEYKTLVVSLSDRTLNTEYTAKLRGRQYVEIRPQVSGLITEIRINEGDAVHKGQILFVIDQVPYKAALETAIANVKSAEAQLATAKLQVLAFENDIKLSGNSYTIYVNQDEDDGVIDVFMETK